MNIAINPNDLLWYLTTHDDDVEQAVRTTLSNSDPGSGMDGPGPTQVSLDTCTGRKQYLYTPPEHMIKIMLANKKYDGKFRVYIKEKVISIGCPIDAESAKMILGMTRFDMASVTYKDLTKAMLDAKIEDHSEKIVFAAQDINQEEVKKELEIRKGNKDIQVYRTRKLRALKEKYETKRLEPKNLIGYDLAAYRALRTNEFMVLVRKIRGKYYFIIEFWMKFKSLKQKTVTKLSA